MDFYCPNGFSAQISKYHTRMLVLAAGGSLAVALTASPTARADMLHQDPAANAQPAPQQPVEHPSSANIPAPNEATGAAPLRVMVGKSLLINTSERLKRVSVTDPGVADISVVTPTQVLVHGRSAGEVSLLIWDELERSRSFDLRVRADHRHTLPLRHCAFRPRLR